MFLQCFIEKTTSAVDAEVRHMSKNLVVTQLLFTLIILTVSGFISIKPESLDPSVAKENGLFFITSIKDFCSSLAKAPFSMQADFVRAQEYALAIWLSEKISLNSGLR